MPRTGPVQQPHTCPRFDKLRLHVGESLTYPVGIGAPVNRRVFLGSVGTVLSTGLLGRRAFGDGEEALDVRIWTSEAAAAHDGVTERVRGYLTAALEPLVGAVDVRVSDESVPLPREGGREVLGKRWPRMVLEGAGGLRGIDPVTGVNLLVTDGDPTKQPAGFARPHVAAATGAEAIASMDPVEETGPLVQNSIPAAATQLLLHECGHALGLSHDHGAAYETSEGVVVTPMVSSYLWADPSIRERELGSGNVCGDGYVEHHDGENRQLRLRYADCASRALRR